MYLFLEKIDHYSTESCILFTDYVEMSDEKKRQQKLWSESMTR